MTTITAYTYEAATHCIACTLRRFRCDESLLDACEDREGNAPHPVFSTDAEPDGYCDTCGLAYGNAEPVAPLLSVEARAAQAEEWAESWRDDFLRLCEKSGQRPGITQAGALVAIPTGENAA